MNYNQDLFYAIFSQSGKSGALDALMIFGADYLVFIIAFIIILAFFIGGKKEKRGVYLAVVGGIITIIGIQIIHTFLQTPRPFVENNIIPLIKMGSRMDSFPSTHSALMAVIAFAFWFSKSGLAIPLILAMLIVGFCRIFVGVHYPIDIFGGILLGFLATYLASLTINKFFKIF